MIEDGPKNEEHKDEVNVVPAAESKVDVRDEAKEDIKTEPTAEVKDDEPKIEPTLEAKRVDDQKNPEEDKKEKET